MKALAIIGYHHSGKTTLACELIRLLTQSGHKVASIKDIHAESYHVDTPGKNTALHLDAGSTCVFAKGLHDSGLLFPNSLSLKEMLPYFRADYLIIEGMKEAPVPKIICAESPEQWDELIDATTIGLSGLIADKFTEYKGLPVFCLQRDKDKLINTIIEKTFEILPLSDPQCCSACGKTCFQMAGEIVQGISKRCDCVLDNAKELRLFVGNEEIVIVPFVQKILKDVITGFVDNLKDTSTGKEIRIEIKR